MDHILLADAGSTKTKWVEITSKKQVKEFQTDGFNPAFYQKTDFSIPEKLNYQKIKLVYYYGAGVIGQESSKIIKIKLQKEFPEAKIAIASDLLAAARGTLGNKKGGIGILGTGSNSAYYDGNKLVSKIPSLGYMLGDEGGGVDLGKRILKNYFYGIMPTNISQIFEQKYKLKKVDFLSNLKSHPSPGKFLASFASFLNEVEGNWKKNLLLDSFYSFFAIRNRDFLKTDHNYMIGGVANAHRDILSQAAINWNIKICAIAKDPIEGLIKYHIQEYYE